MWLTIRRWGNIFNFMWVSVPRGPGAADGGKAVREFGIRYPNMHSCIVGFKESAREFSYMALPCVMVGNVD